MLRLFVAIDVPSSLKKLAAEQHRPLEGVRWTKTDNLHLTLRFIGDTDPDMLHGLREALESISANSFTVKTSHPLLLPSQRKARVLALALDSSAELDSLQKQVEQTVSETLGIKAESRPYRPHVTLARFRGATSGVIQQARTLIEEVASQTIDVSQITLYESRLEPDGARHHALATLALTK